MVMRCYAGVETRDDALWLHPRLPAEVDEASFQIVYRGQPVDVTLQQQRAKLRLLSGSVRPIRVRIEGIEKTLSPGEVWEVPLAA